jgi:AcrR family transcriptional regulator
MAQPTENGRRPLSRDRVLRAAVTLADDAGIDAVSMRRLAQELGVVPMALYKHVANKDELLDGMIDAIVGEIEPPEPSADWQPAVRQRILSARRALRRHPWASRLIASRPVPTPVELAYLESVIGMFRTGGFSVDLTHHVMHALGSRMFGFTQELFDDSASVDPDVRAAALRHLSGSHPNLVELAAEGGHDARSAAGPPCDDQFEFEFGLDLLLDGFDRLHRHGWSTAGPPEGALAGRPRSG